jgi:hypothetical protein
MVKTLFTFKFAYETLDVRLYVSAVSLRTSSGEPPQAKIAASPRALSFSEIAHSSLAFQSQHCHVCSEAQEKDHQTPAVAKVATPENSSTGATFSVMLRRTMHKLQIAAGCSASVENM